MIHRGLDNAGKTTILKRLNGEDVHSISPTLGFKIYSMDYKSHFLVGTESLIVFTSTFGMLGAKRPFVTTGRIISRKWLLRSAVITRQTR